ncbi:MAG TPA: hypothetical protein VIS76_10835 [Pseudomonadales bacterium]
MNLNRPWRRLAGLLVILACLTVYEPGTAGVDQRLLYPLILSLGAWALVQNLTAVALAGTVLAAIHASPGAEDWIIGVAYPGLAATGAVVLLWTGGQRFRRRIAETHAARWSDRRPS